jgi:hypothetical protein
MELSDNIIYEQHLQQMAEEAAEEQAARALNQLQQPRAPAKPALKRVRRRLILDSDAEPEDKSDEELPPAEIHREDDETDEELALPPYPIPQELRPRLIAHDSRKIQKVRDALNSEEIHLHNVRRQYVLEHNEWADRINAKREWLHEHQALGQPLEYVLSK